MRANPNTASDTISEYFFHLPSHKHFFSCFLHSMGFLSAQILLIENKARKWQGEADDGGQKS